MNIRMESDLNDAFLACCKAQDTTGSQVIRKFIREYIKKHGQIDAFGFKEKKR